ncbi:MAG TPA: hypothetical protein VD927_01995 [Chryseosolibacter sp.]|nr:hypothetical protein [Chryseosolibacter sp.]
MPKLFVVLSAALLFVTAYPFDAIAQECQSSISVKLENIRGGVYAGKEVILKSRVDGTTFSTKTGSDGIAELTVPCNELFDVSISNYTRKVEIISPMSGKITQTLSYAPDMVEKQKLMTMTTSEIETVDNFFKSLPDTIFLKTSVMPPPVKQDLYSWVVISLKDLTGAPLRNETMTITGRARNKSIKGATDKSGRLLCYLPKGDAYDIGFKHHPRYYYTDCAYTKGTSDIKLNFSYIGTKEMERRLKEEHERIVAEETRLRREKEAFEKRCEALGLSKEECHKREIERYKTGEIPFEDTVIHVVMKRNNWQKKLIVCDVTGSMSPYVAQLSAWYQLNLLREKTATFVFFNDGDNMPDNKKIIGKTGGIYYSRATTADSLNVLMSKAQARGSGGDAPENNMEALLFAIAKAKEFDHVIMIADNHAPVKDIRLLTHLNVPVHIILCGTGGAVIEPDYLQIAWKTKGSVHTIEDDIYTLARLSEGQEVNVQGIKYKIMGGEFIAVN